MKRLTAISEISDNELAMPIKMKESCGEDGCRDVCEDYYDCVGCPVQECLTKLAAYENTNLEPEEIETLIELHFSKYDKCDTEQLNSSDKQELNENNDSWLMDRFTKIN